MSAAVRTYTADEKRLQHRDDAMHDMLFLTAGQSGLSHDGEMAIRMAVGRQLEPLLHLADSAVAAKLELEAIEGRLNRHREGCRICRPEQACLRYRLSDIQRNKLQGLWDRAYRALVGRR